MNGSQGRLTGRMADKSHHSGSAHGSVGSDPDQIDRLGSEFRALDSKLVEYARRYPVPQGLSWRIYQASVGLLPGTKSARRPRLLRLEPMSPASIWGRLALAASIGLAVVVGSRLLPSGGPTPHEQWLLAAYSGASDTALGGAIHEFDDPRFAQLEHLLMTRETTFLDLTSDVELLASDLEM